MRVATGAADWLPLAYKNPESSENKGVAYDVAKLVADELSIPLDVQHPPWSRMLLQLANGELDMALALYWNKERSKKYVYTQPYLNNEARIFVKKGREFAYGKFEDLMDRQGIIPAGSSFGEAFDAFVKNNAPPLLLSHMRSNKDNMAKMVMLERADYFIQDYLDGMIYLKSRGLDDTIVPLPTPLSENQVHFALSRNSPCIHLAPKINEIIQRLRQQGIVEEITNDHIQQITSIAKTSNSP